MRYCLLWFIPPTEWNESSIAQTFRGWVSFHSFVMMSDSAHHYNMDGASIETCIYSTPSGSPGDETDQYKAKDFDDVARELYQQVTMPQNLLPLSYRSLYKMYVSLSDSKKEVIDWFAAEPILPNRFDAFCNRFAPILHYCILLDAMIGTPPTCDSGITPCNQCGRSPQPHYRISRRDWLMTFLSTAIEDEIIRDQYKQVIESAFSLRNRIAHAPTNDTSRVLPVDIDRHVERYDIFRSTGEYKKDTFALIALLIQLRQVCRNIAVYQLFNLDYFFPLPVLSVATVKSSGPVSM